MKKLILFALLIGVKAGAQEFEGRVGGGFSINGTPSGNMAYKGDQSLMNYSTNLQLLYTTKNNWMLGLEGHMLELASKSTKKYLGYINGSYLLDSIGGDDKKMVYAKYAVSICGVVNKRFDFNGGSSYFYVGGAIGYASARNNAHRYQSNESYKAPDGGRGLCYGAQLGFAANVTEKIGIYLEAAMRFYNFDYRDAGAPLVWKSPDNSGEVLKYSINAFPVTFGIKYTFMKIQSNQYGTYNRDKTRFYENKRFYQRKKPADGRW
jgi:hypothetical protein